MKLSIFINRIFRNTFPVKLYYHFSLVNWTAATESATSYEHAHCAWYGLFFYNSRTKSTDKVTGFYLSIIVLWRSETEEHLSAANV